MAAGTPAPSGAIPAPGTFQLAAGAEGHLTAQGPLTFATARQARELGRRALADSSAAPLQVDLSGVSPTDSAGLAVLIDWLAEARRAQRSLRYRDLPGGLSALARISELEELLGRGV